MQILADVASDLRRRADATILNVADLAQDSADQFRVKAMGIHAAMIEVHGTPVRLQFTRDRIGSRDFYHLSIGTLDRSHPGPEDILAIVAAFFPDGNALAIPSVLGNSFQFLGPPIANDSLASQSIHPLTPDP